MKSGVQITPRWSKFLSRLEKTKNIQMQLEAGDQLKLMLIGGQIIQLLYTDKTLNDATGAARTFASAFRNKLAHCIDLQDIMMEWAIAAFLDPR